MEECFSSNDDVEENVWKSHMALVKLVTEKDKRRPDLFFFKTLRNRGKKVLALAVRGNWATQCLTLEQR